MDAECSVSAPVFKFGPAAGFQAELKKRVQEYFIRAGRSQHGGFRLGLKAIIITVWLTASYCLLVFGAETWWQTAVLALSLSLAMAAVGFNIQHDGNHESFSKYRWVNRLRGAGLDLLGGSSYMWRLQHNVFHHSYANLAGADHDIDTGGIGRLSPAQGLRRFHRFQQFYLWPPYATVALKWQLFDDFHQLITGRLSSRSASDRRRNHRRRTRKTGQAGMGQNSISPMQPSSRFNPCQACLPPSFPLFPY